MTELQQKYRNKIIPLMKAKFGFKNNLEAPAISKVVINVGVGKTLKEPKLLNGIIENIKRISGQAPVKTLAKQSIASFNIKEGNIVGLVTTLRGDRMYEFLNKLINFTLPRVRDFRGLSPESFDGRGNYSLGFKEQTVFPEIRTDEVEKIHGLEVCISTTAKNNEEGLELLRAFGFYFRKRGERKKEEDLKEVGKKEAVLKRYEAMKKKQAVEKAKLEAKAVPKKEEVKEKVKK